MVPANVRTRQSQTATIVVDTGNAVESQKSTVYYLLVMDGKKKKKNEKENI